MQQTQVPVVQTLRKSQLSRSQSRLVELMQRLNFGRIVGLTIRAGLPDFSQPYRVIRTVKLAGGENGARPEAARPDVVLRREHTELLAQMQVLPDGTHVTIEVKYGLPFLAEIEQEHRE